MNRVMNKLPALLFASLLTAMSVGCVERTTVDEDQNAAANGDSQTADMVSDENPNGAPTNLRAQEGVPSSCANCGPLPDPWTMGPLPDPWQTKPIRDVGSELVDPSATKKDTTTNGATGSGGTNHKD